jgi:hypothetical protein
MIPVDIMIASDPNYNLGFNFKGTFQSKLNLFRYLDKYACMHLYFITIMLFLWRKF